MDNKLASQRSDDAVQGFTRPTIGRIVHYVDNQNMIYPGIILFVHDSQNVDLKVFRRDGNDLTVSGVPFAGGNTKGNTWSYPLRDDSANVASGTGTNR